MTLDYAHTRSLDVSDEKQQQKMQQHYLSQSDLKVLEKKTRLTLSFSVEAGDRGLYRGLVKVGAEYYGVIEQSAGHAKLLPMDQLSSREKEQWMVVEAYQDSSGHTSFKGVQPDIQQRNQSRGREIDLGEL